MDTFDLLKLNTMDNLRYFFTFFYKWVVIILSSIIWFAIFPFIWIIIEIHLFPINQHNPLWTLFVMAQTAANCFIGVSIIGNIHNLLFKNEF